MDRGEIRIEVEADGETRTEYASPDPPEPDAPFRVLVLADLSGRDAAPGSAAGDGQPLAERETVSVDRDRLDAVIDHLSPAVQVAGTTLRVGSMEDFHPDRLFERLPVFDRIRREFGSGGPPAPERDTGGSGSEGGAGDPEGGDEAPGSSGDLLDAIVEEEEGASGGGGMTEGDVPDREGLAGFVDRIVEPHRVRGLDPRERAHAERRDRALQEAMREVLHDPAFQRLESTWRGIRFLVRRVETGPDLEIRLLDVSRSELVEALAEDDPERSPLYGPLVRNAEGTAGATGWSLLVTAYRFGPEDARLLRRLGRLGRRAGAPVLGEAVPALAGLEDLRQRPSRSDWSEVEEDDWRELRQVADARWLGLGLPRFLLRMPYHPDDTPLRALEFSELPEEGERNDAEDEGPPRHERYLWGNPAWLCAALLCRSFRKAGWEMRAGMDREMDRLPLHLYERRGRTEAKPAAEMLMTEDVATRLMERGFTPLASLKERGAVRVVRFQSVADPPTRLAGRWEASGG